MEVLSYSAAGMLFAIAGHILACRAGCGALRAYATSLVVGAAISAGIASSGDSAWVIVTTLEIYGAWWFVFLNLVQASESSLRMQILREVIAAGGAMPMSELLSRYNDDTLLRLRLRRLVEGKGVALREGRLHVRSALLRGLARFFLGLKLVTLGKRSEFD